MQGEPLFSGGSELEQMQQFVSVLGLPPRVVVDRSRKAHVYFEYDQFGHCVLRGGAPGRAVCLPSLPARCSTAADPGSPPSQSSVSKLASVISEHVPIVRHSQLEHSTRPTGVPCACTAR